MEGRAAARLGDSTRVEPSREWLLAVGIPKGIASPSFSGEGEPTGWVNAGGKLIPVVVPVYDAWFSALRPKQPQQLASLASRVGIDDPEDFIATALDRGLLLQIDHATTISDLEDLRVIPLAVGAGTDPDHSDMYCITDVGAQTAVRMNSAAYALWANLDGAAVIAEVCRRVIRDSREFAPPGVEESVVTTGVPPLLLALMDARYIFLDRTVKDEILG